jgi:glucose/arabinose dehydrogenase
MSPHESRIPRGCSHSAWILSWVLMGLALGVSGASASTLPQGFQETPVITGRTEPTAIRFAPNGQAFLAEKSGLLWVYANITDPSPSQVIDLRAEVHDYWDRGLLGLAIDPGYPARPYVYVLYAHDTWPPGDPRFGDPTQPRWGTGLPNPSTSDPCPTPPGPTADGCVVYGRLSRITIDPNTLQGTEQVLIQGNWCQQFPSHSIGDLHFGNDGYLYVSGGEGANFNAADWGQYGNQYSGDVVNPCGDPNGAANDSSSEGGALRSQDILSPSDPTAYSGSILRLDVSTLPVQAAPGNPLIGYNGSDDDPVVAIGLRNPYRFTIRPGTNEVWIADVGWNTWEEINRIQDPTAFVSDFGWPCYEGGPGGVNQPQGSYDQQILCQRLAGLAQPPVPSYVHLTPPYFAYQHSQQVVPGELCGTGGSSVTGIAFYTGQTFPAAYRGALFFADSTRQCIWTMPLGTNGDPDPSAVQPFVSNAAGRIVDLQNGPDGNLYYVDFDNGAVYKVAYYAGNQPPHAVATATPTSGVAPLQVQFDGSGSSDPEDGTAVTYAWDLNGDGVFDDSTIAKPTWTYQLPGQVLARLKVTDSQGASDIASVTINAGNTAPVVTITAPDPSLKWKVGDSIAFAGGATDQQNGTLDPSRLSWDIILHHCFTPDDCHIHDITTIPGVDSGSFIAPDHEYPSYLELRLTATDLPPAGWFDEAWTRRRLLLFDNSAQAANLIDFPVLVVLDPTRIDYGHTLPNGRDLRFTDDAGNLLAYEIESWNPGGTSYVWVKVPQITAGSTSDSIWMYYGNPSAATSAENAPAVWSAGYAGVWHMGSSLADSTANGDDGVDSGSTATTGPLGPARSFDGVASSIDVGTSPALEINGDLTVEAWVRAADPSQPGAPRVVSKKNNWDDPAGYNLEVHPGEGNVTTVGSGNDYTRADGLSLGNTWHYVATVVTGAIGRVYVDGLDRTTDSTVSPIVSSAQHMTFGRRSGGGDFFDGDVDEVRVSNVARSADWIAAQDLSMTDAFITYGPENLIGTLSTTASERLDPLTADVTYQTSPAGLTLTVGTETGPAPLVETSIVNGQVSVEAPSPQTQGGKVWAFQSWSDGGGQAHTIVTPQGGGTLTATYAALPACSDGIDNDGDGLIDYPQDPGCRNAMSDKENPQCQDGIDNDGDGKIDWPADLDCQAPWGDSEATPTGSSCGFGFELVGLLPLLRRLARLRSRLTRGPSPR